MAIETNSIAVIPLTLFSALFAVSLTLYLTFLFSSKLELLRERRNKYVIKFIKPYFEKYAELERYVEKESQKDESQKDEYQKEQVTIIGALFKKTDYRIFFADVTPSGFLIATILFVITTALSILLAFYYNVIILIIVIIIGVSGGVYFIDDIRYFIKLSKLMEDTK